MGFVSVEHAEREIVRKLADGPIGDDDITFSNVLTRGMPVTDGVLALVYQAVDNLESSGKVAVIRNSSTGCPQMVELCADQTVTKPSPTLSLVKRSLSKFELLKEMHDLLKDMSDDSGVIHSNCKHDEFVKLIHKKLSERFDVDMLQVKAVFGAMTALDLRTNSRCLRGIGMSVLQESLIDLVSDGDSRLKAARDYAERTRLELEQVTEQLAAARAVTSQQELDLVDVRGRHERATEQIQSMREELERVTMSRDQLRRNNEDLKAKNERLRQLPVNAVTALQEMIAMNTEE